MIFRGASLLFAIAFSALIYIAYFNSYLERPLIRKRYFESELRPLSSEAAEIPLNVISSSISGGGFKRLRLSCGVGEFVSPPHFLHDFRLSGPQWQLLNHHRTWLFAAHIDTRLSPTIARILSVSSDLINVTVHCQLWYKNVHGRIAVVRIVQAQRFYYPTFGPNSRYRHREYREKYPLMFHCPLPLNVSALPFAVSIVSGDNACDRATNMLKLRRPRKEKKGYLSMCVSPRTHFNGDLKEAEKVALRLVEWIELQKLLGFEKIFYYVYSVMPSIEAVLRHYEALGLVEIRPFSVTADHPNSPRWRDAFVGWKRGVWVHFQMVARHDCIFRNMYDYDWIGVADPDEVFVPNKEQTITKLLRRLDARYQNISLVTFRSAFFPPFKKSM